MAKGKGKGSAWERKLSRIFTKWVSGQDKEEYYWRSPGSGAVATINVGNKAITGDIIPLKFEGAWFTDIWSIEAKNGYPAGSIDLHLKQNKNEIIKDFWDQACDDATKADKLPMLVYKKKGFPNPWVGFCPIANEKIKKHLKGLRFVHMCFGDDRPDLYFYNLNELFVENKLTPEIVKQEFN